MFASHVRVYGLHDVIECFSATFIEGGKIVGLTSGGTAVQCRLRPYPVRKWDVRY